MRLVYTIRTVRLHRNKLRSNIVSMHSRSYLLSTQILKTIIRVLFTSLQALIIILEPCIINI